MGNAIEYFIIAVLFILLLYGLTMQIKQTMLIQKAGDKKVPSFKRTLAGNYVTSISFLGFAVSFVLNIAAILPTNFTAISCFIFLIILFIAKFGIIPKQQFNFNHRRYERKRI